MPYRTCQKEVACTPFIVGQAQPVKNDKGIYSMAPRTNLVALIAKADHEPLGIKKGDEVFVAQEQAASGWGRAILRIDPDLGEFIMVPAEQVRLVCSYTEK